MSHSLLCISEYQSWDPRRVGQIDVLDRVQQKTAQFTNHMKGCDWQTLSQHIIIAQLCALFKSCCGQQAWKAICDRHRVGYNTT